MGSVGYLPSKRLVGGALSQVGCVGNLGYCPHHITVCDQNNIDAYIHPYPKYDLTYPKAIACQKVPNRYHFYEVYADDAAIDHHKTPCLQETTIWG